jgi:hypothetical protein
MAVTRRRLGYLLILFALLFSSGFAVAGRSVTLFQAPFAFSQAEAREQSDAQQQQREARVESRAAYSVRPSRLRASSTYASLTGRLLPFALYQRPPPIAVL